MKIKIIIETDKSSALEISTDLKEVLKELCPNWYKLKKIVIGD